MRPAISDSLISGQPLYLLYSNCPPARATQATGSVRLQVTGSPPTTNDPRAANALMGNAAAAAPSRSALRRPSIGDGAIIVVVRVVAPSNHDHKDRNGEPPQCGAASDVVLVTGEDSESRAEDRAAPAELP